MRRRLLLEQATAELEWRSYKDDAESFFHDCVWIPNLRDERGRSKFEMFDYQQETLETWSTNRFVMVLKARQLGLTTLAMAYAFHHLLFRPGATVLLISRDQKTANKALGLLEFMWDFMPQRMKSRAPKLVTDAGTEKVWKFPDGMTSRIVSRPATGASGVSETATLVLWDEAALAQDGDGTYRALEPTTDAGGQMIVFSTARGAHNRFARMWRAAKRGESRFVTVFHPWTASRLIDEAGYEAKRKEMRDKPWLFHAEYPADPEEAFRQSGRLRFDQLPPEDVWEDFPNRGYLEEDPVLGIQFVHDEQGPLRLRDEALFGAPDWAKCAVSVDPAMGKGGDYTAMTAGWMDPDGIPFRAAYWHSNVIEPIEAAQQADLLGRFFGGRQRAALLAVEKAGGYGETFIHELANTCRYPNQYVHRYTGHRKRKQEQTYGFPMTTSRRPLVIDRLSEWVRHDGEHPVLDGIDELLCTELGQFVITEQGRVQADVGCHDDLVMSTAIWVWLLTEVVGVSQVDATPVSTDDNTSVHDLSYVFEEAERIRAARNRAGRRQLRRARRMRGRR